MDKNTCGISGVWSGCFWRGPDASDKVLFSAWLHTSDGKLHGSTLEPNALFEHLGDELDASLRGHINKSEIVFLKTYHGVDTEPAYCEGELSDDGKRIVGTWYFGWPDEMSGKFEMSREGTRALSAQTQTESANTSS